ncbi:MAG TPA: extracellular solute-binding protein [Beijerinckiaceae bacterium]|jgi:iron(III) transport system substrate-binding protein|nr:extracellular solute-binding protein [Beijerinckiaceae bacterium]
MQGRLACRRFGAVTGAIFLAFIVGGPAVAADQGLIDAAKKEGSVTWYTTQIVDQFARPAAEAFEKKYGIHVDYVRADPIDIVLRVTTEAKAGHIQADVFDGTATTPGLEKAGLVLKWVPDSASRLPPQYVDRNGYWVATNLYVLTPGYNTNLVPKGTEPRTYQDLLDPKWKGKLAWSRSPAASAGPGVVGLMLTDMGEDKGMAYLRQLAQQQITGVDATARQVLDQVLAGEYPVALGIFNHHAVISAHQGAPVDWIPMEPAMAVLSVISVTQGAPHPNAGKLLVDYLVSSEGQKFFRDADYLPVDPSVPPRVPTLMPDVGKFRAIYFTPEEIQEKLVGWTKIFNQLFQ